MRPYYDIVLIGDYFFDLIYTGLPAFPALGREVYSSDVTSTGGAAYITAVALRRLGVNIGWPACFGNDFYSQTVRQLAIGEGLDLTLARTLDMPYRRITSSIPFQGERAFVTYADPEPPDLLDHWLKSMHVCDFGHVHIVGIMPLEQLQPLFQAAKAHGATLSIDCGDTPLLRGGCEWCDLLSPVDIFMPNAREAQIITGETSVESAARRLTRSVNLAVVKDGANGVCIGHAEEELIRSPGICAGDVIDTTGAGDCFNAGFLLGHIVEKAPLERCARYGNICGGLSVTGVGGATAAPTYDELMRWMAK